MKAVLEFDLPEECAEFRHARQGAVLAGVVLAYLERDLRQWCRYGIPKSANTPKAALEAARDSLMRRLEDVGVDVYSD